MTLQGRAATVATSEATGILSTAELVAPFPQEKLLIVESKQPTATLIRAGLEDTYTILEANDRHEAKRVLLESRPQVALLDLRLPPNYGDTDEGLRTLNELTAEAPLLKVIVVARANEKELGLSAIMAGAYDFFCRPLDIQELGVVVRRAFYLYRLETECQALRGIGGLKDSFEGMLGVSPPIQEVFAKIPRIASSDVSVLITGESGTGKELVARAIHNRSRRRDAPFVAINCGAIPAPLIESELFGHERGAFTGAHNLRKGRMELAHRGTLFLDEVGELPPGLQVKLLRFLDNREFDRVGGSRAIRVDIRIIAATNRNIRQAVRQGTFRQDFYHRIGVIEIELPALREREGDVDYLANFFLRSMAHENRKRLNGFAPSGIKALRGHSWPGNVRELQNRISRAVLLARGPKVTRSDLELNTKGSPYDGMTLRQARDAVETELIRKSMERHRGNLSRTAAELGISRPSLYETIARLGIERIGIRGQGSGIGIGVRDQGSGRPMP
jgi:two-component system NtrC family response regulator